MRTKQHKWSQVFTELLIAIRIFIAIFVVTNQLETHQFNLDSVQLLLSVFHIKRGYFLKKSFN